MTALPILLPESFSSRVRIGDHVKAGEVIAHKEINAEEIVNVPEALDVSPAKARKILKKIPGDNVRVGDVIAVKKKFLGLRKVELVSGVDGIVLRYERGTGNFVLKTGQSDSAEEIVSPVDGIIGLCNNKQIVINTDKNVLVGERGYGETAEGSIFVLEASFAEGESAANVLYHLDSQATQKVIVGGLFTRDLLIKGLGVGAKAFIGMRFADADVEYLAARNVKIPVVEVGENAMRALVKWRGKRVFVEPQSNSVVLLQI